MQPSLTAFADELIKVGGRVPVELLPYDSKNDPEVKELVSSGIHSAPRRYASAVALAAVVAPLMTMLSRRVGQIVHNQSVMRAVERAVGGSQRRRLMKELKVGKIWGSGFGHAAGAEPLMTPSNLASDVASGAVTGSVVQALRDRLNPDRR